MELSLMPAQSVRWRGCTAARPSARSWNAWARTSVTPRKSSSSATWASEMWSMVMAMGWKRSAEARRHGLVPRGGLLESLGGAQDQRRGQGPTDERHRDGHPLPRLARLHRDGAQVEQVD